MSKKNLRNYSTRSLEKAAELLLHNQFALSDADSYALAFVSKKEWHSLSPEKTPRFRVLDVGGDISIIKQQIIITVDQKRNGEIAGFHYKLVSGKRTIKGYVSDQNLALSKGTIHQHVANHQTNALKDKIIQLLIGRRHITSLKTIYVKEENYKEYLEQGYELKVLPNEPWVLMTPRDNQIFVSYMRDKDGKSFIRYKCISDGRVITNTLNDSQLSLAEGTIDNLIREKRDDKLKWLILDHTKTIGHTHKTVRPEITKLKKTVAPENFFLKRTVFGRKAAKAGSQGRADQATPDGKARTVTVGDTSFFSDRTPGNEIKKALQNGKKLHWVTSKVVYIPVVTAEQESGNRKALSKKLPQVKIRDAFNQKHGQRTLEVLHGIAHRFMKGAGEEPHATENLVLGTPDANSAMILVEDTVSALSVKYGIGFYLWFDNAIDEDGITHKLHYHVSLTEPYLVADAINPDYKTTQTRHCVAEFPLLLDTRPSRELQPLIFKHIEDFFGLAPTVLSSKTPALADQLSSFILSKPPKSTPAVDTASPKRTIREFPQTLSRTESVSSPLTSKVLGTPSKRQRTPCKDLSDSPMAVSSTPLSPVSVDPRSYRPTFYHRAKKVINFSIDAAENLTPQITENQFPGPLSDDLSDLSDDVFNTSHSSSTTESNVTSAISKGHQHFGFFGSGVRSDDNGLSEAHEASFTMLSLRDDVCP